MTTTENHETALIVNRILHLGKSDFTGITYTKESLENLVEKWKQSTTPLFGSTQNDFLNGLDLSEIATTIVDMYVDDEGLVVVQKILDTPSGSLMRALSAPDLSLGYKVSPVIRNTGETFTLEYLNYSGLSSKDSDK